MASRNLWKSRREGGLRPWKSRRERGSGGSGNPGGGGRGQKSMPSVGGVWIFSGITQFTCSNNYIEMSWTLR